MEPPINRAIKPNRRHIRDLFIARPAARSANSSLDKRRPHVARVYIADQLDAAHPRRQHEPQPAVLDLLVVHHRPEDLVVVQLRELGGQTQTAEQPLLPGGELGVHVPKKDVPPEQRETEFVACTFGLDNGNYSEVIEGLSEGVVVYTKLPTKTQKEKQRKRRKE